MNKVILCGRIGQDPEVRFTQAGLAIANVSLATNKSVKNKQTGQWEDTPEWHRLVFFDRKAEVIKEYTRKGSMILVEGELQTRKWTDQEGKDRWTTEVKCYQLELLTPKDSKSPESQPEKADEYPEPQPMPLEDDDIPF
jgi:single-strand DNA-binding protein